MDDLNSRGSYEHRIAKVQQIREDILTGSRIAISPDVSDETIARMQEHVANLTDEELAAIQGYSSQDYETLNKVMRNPAADPKTTAAMQGYIDAVRRGLDKLPAFEGEVYRGTALSQRNWQKVVAAHESGEPFTDPAFSSSSEDKQVAEEFLERGRADNKVPVMFTIHSRTGKQIEFLSKTANEVEVLFSGGAKFKVVDIWESTGPDGLPRKEVLLRELVDEHTETTDPADASRTTIAPTRGNAAALETFHGNARPKAQDNVTANHLQGIVASNVRHVLPPGFVWVDGLTFKTPDGQLVTIDVDPNTAVDDKTPVAHYQANTILVSPRAADADIVRAIAHELAEIRAETVLKLGGDDSERPQQATKHLEGRFAEARVLLSQLDAVRQRPNDANIEGQSSDVTQLNQQLTDLLYTLGVFDEAHQQQVMALLAQSDGPLATRVRLWLADLTRPSVRATTSEAEFKLSSQMYLEKLQQQASGEHVDSLVTIESVALAGAMNREQVYRLFDPLFEDAAITAQRALPKAARSVLFGAQARMRDVLNNVSISDEMRASQLEALIDEIAVNAQLAPLMQVIGTAGIARMKAAARDLKRSGQQPGILVMNEQTRMVSVGTSVPSNLGVAAGEMSFDQLVATVDKANMTARENGLDIEYVVIVHRGITGQSMIEILPRPRPRYRVGKDQMETKADQKSPLRDGSGRYVVDVGVGRSAAGIEMSGHEPGKTTLIQTEYIDDAEIAQMRRDQGVLDPAPIAGDGSVLVYCDFLMNATVITGPQGVTKVVLNNVSAHLETDDEYRTVAHQLLQVMAPGGEIEIQWDDSDEQGRADPQYKGTRGHVDGNRLLDMLQTLNPKIVGTKLPPLKYPYSINAAKSNKFENPGFTNPDPKYRVVIRF